MLPRAQRFEHIDDAIEFVTPGNPSTCIFRLEIIAYIHFLAQIDVNVGRWGQC